MLLLLVELLQFTGQLLAQRLTFRIGQREALLVEIKIFVSLSPEELAVRYLLRLIVRGLRK